MGNNNTYTKSDIDDIDEETLDNTYNIIKSYIEKMPNHSNTLINIQSSMNPELYDDEASQQLLEAVVSKNMSEKNLNILLERKPNPNTKDSLGKSILEYMFEQEHYELVIKMLCTGAILSKSMLKKCLRLFVRCTDTWKSYNDTIIAAAQNMEVVSKEELLDMLYRLRNINHYIKYRFTNELVLKGMNNFQRRLELYASKLTNNGNSGYMDKPKPIPSAPPL